MQMNPLGVSTGTHFSDDEALFDAGSFSDVKLGIVGVQCRQPIPVADQNGVPIAIFPPGKYDSASSDSADFFIAISGDIDAFVHPSVPYAISGRDSAFCRPDKLPSNLSYRALTDWLLWLNLFYSGDKYLHAGSYITRVINIV